MLHNRSTTETDQNAGRLSYKQIYQLLSARRRRYVLYCLYRSENPVQLSDLADQVTEWEYETPSLPEDRSHVYTTLYHTHIPKLSVTSVISYSQDAEVVELGANAYQLRPYLEETAENDLTLEDTGRL